MQALGILLEFSKLAFEGGVLVEFRRISARRLASPFHMPDIFQVLREGRVVAIGCIVSGGRLLIEAAERLDTLGNGLCVYASCGPVVDFLFAIDADRQPSDSQRFDLAWSPMIRGVFVAGHGAVRCLPPELCGASSIVWDGDQIKIQ